MTKRTPGGSIGTFDMEGSIDGPSYALGVPSDRAVDAQRAGEHSR